MKLRAIGISVGLVLAVGGAVNGAAALSSAFTYQGQINKNGAPANGTCDFSFGLYDAALGGSLVGGQISYGVSVSNGLFSVLLDLNPGVNIFNGADRWLEIVTRCPAGSGAWSGALTPREQIAATPYSLYAPAAGSASNLTCTGCISDLQVSGTAGIAYSKLSGAPTSLPPSGAAAGDLTGTYPNPTINSVPYSKVTGAPTSLPPSGAAGGDLTGTYPNPTINTSTVQKRVTGTCASGTAMTQIGANGTPTCAAAVSFAGSGIAATAARSDHNHVGDSWSGDPTHMVLGLTIHDPVLSAANTNGGTGVFGHSVSGAGVHGHSDNGYGGQFNSDNDAGVFAKGGSNAVPDLILGGNSSSSDDGIISSDPAYPGSDIYLNSNDAVVVRLDQNGTQAGNFEIHDGSDENIFSVKEYTAGVGVTDNHGKLNVYADGYSGVATAGALTAGTNDNNAIWGTNSSTHTTIVSQNKGTGDYYRALNENGTTVFWVTHTGRVKTTAVEITGGGDLGEKFHVQSPAKVEPGTLMVIDDKNPGALKVSEQAYDTRVAGIVSGARGVNPGMTLEQEGVLDGDVTVAIAGRVYVKADAQTAPIQPGDLLTTSALRGAAMKASDRALAQGATIGKAMSRLDEGTGLVLVLVNLQ
jgi:hypothetical protein